MLSVGVYIVSLIIIFVTGWIYKWRNPKCDGLLPPGSSGIPLIGESHQLFIPSYSHDVHPFIKKRLQRHGPLFRTNVAGRNVVVSADQEFNSFIIQQENKLVVRWYLDSFEKLLKHGDGKPDTLTMHKYMRSLVLSHFGPETMRQNLLSQFEDIVRKTIHSWSLQQDAIDVGYASVAMYGEFVGNKMCSFDPEKSKELIHTFMNGIKIAMSLPLNIPGTTYHKCLKDKEKASKMLMDAVNDRLASPENVEENVEDDLLSKMIKDMNTVNFVTKEYIVHLLYSFMFSTFQTIPTVAAFALNFVSKNPAVVGELTAEHDEILRKRQNLDSSVTWEEYKSMTFTLQVINETLRLGNSVPGFLRKAIKDIKVNGYTIPAGWGIMTCHSAMHLDPNIYEDPLTFNPWRWKDVDPEFMSKNLKPFGGGINQCSGADFSRAAIAIFLHVLVTKYRWSIVKGGDIIQDPTMRLKNGLHINVRKRQD
ncbi:hypothetical protein DH2020_029512 [Rehmannia glutinosa]|uniref:Cytochrome P450 n=1 Tax=Rehmannia glutinosa TaxID=99300 RepID=A0ABR0VQ51_REHGL